MSSATHAVGFRYSQLFHSTIPIIMKNALKTLLIVAALGFTTIVNAIQIPSSGIIDPITQTDNNGDPNASGGEFLTHFTSGPTLYTFCLESQQHLTSGATYKYEIGGTITNGTAYLMKLFALGQLPGYSFDTTGEGSDRDIEAGKLQKAIWALEGQAYGEVNFYYNLAASVAGFGDVYTGLEVVRVMLTEKWDGSAWVAGNYQDQVVYVPDSGATLALLGLGLAGLAIARRRR